MHWGHSIFGLEKEWPKSTKISCWWCTEPFDGPPVCIPRNKPSLKTVDCYGVFCDFPCAKAYLKHDPNLRTLGRAEPSLLADLRLKMTGSIAPYDAAPPRQALKKFGGDMTVSEFRSNKTQIAIFPTNFKPASTFMEEEDVSKNKRDGFPSTRGPKELTLCRAAPLPRRSVPITQFFKKGA